MSRARVITIVALVVSAAALASAANQRKLTCTNDQLAQCQYSSLPACGPTEFPALQTGNPCCPISASCRLPAQCTTDAIKACPWDKASTPLCADNAWPTRTSDSSCCPTCVPKPPLADRCKTDPRDLPVCVQGTVPSFDESTGCFTCRPADGRIGNCTLESVVHCSNSFGSLPVCDASTTPQRQIQDWRSMFSFDSGSCCLMCQPNWLSYCNADTIRTCLESYPDLRICANGESPTFNQQTCCRSCRLANELGDGYCTLDEYRTCFNNLPVCADGEQPYYPNVTQSCCPSCRRPERLCAVEDVANCEINQPDCANGEQPTHVSGECCATCKYPKAPCNCNGDQMCVYKQNSGDAPTCANKHTTSFRIKPVADLRSQLGNLNPLQIKYVAMEILARFCDHTNNNARCQQRSTQLYNSDFIAVPNPDGSYTVNVVYPDVPNDATTTAAPQTPANAQFFSYKSPTLFNSLNKLFRTTPAGQGISGSDAAIYRDAAADAESGAGFTVVPDSSSGVSPRTAAGAAAVAVAVAAALALRV